MRACMQKPDVYMCIQFFWNN